jgi:hypothetical protein
MGKTKRNGCDQGTENKDKIAQQAWTNKKVAGEVL